MTVVVNSTPLIYLAAIGKFELLRTLYGRIIIPMAVFDEVVIQGVEQWGAAETAAASWIERRVVTDRSEVSALLGQLDLGESEVIVLAQELSADLAIVDETAARRALANRGLAFIGTVGVLMQARLRGLIPSLKVDRFDCDHLEPVGREFLLDDWRRRESDLLFRLWFVLSWALRRRPAGE